MEIRRPTEKLNQDEINMLDCMFTNHKFISQFAPDFRVAHRVI